VNPEQLESLEAQCGGSVCYTVDYGHCLGVQLLLSDSPQVMQCPEAALQWSGLATEWLPETEAPVTAVTKNSFLFLFYFLLLLLFQ
jgi:hypothetical protein